MWLARSNSLSRAHLKQTVIHSNTESREISESSSQVVYPEFINTQRVIRVRTRKQPDELLCCDRSARWEKYEYRQCKRCGRKLIAVAAVMRRDDENRARRMGLADPPCNGRGTVRGEHGISRSSYCELDS